MSLLQCISRYTYTAAASTYIVAISSFAFTNEIALFLKVVVAAAAAPVLLQVLLPLHVRLVVKFQCFSSFVWLKASDKLRQVATNPPLFIWKPFILPSDIRPSQKQVVRIQIAKRYER